MFAMLAKLLAGPIVDKVLDVFKSFQDRKATEAEIRGAVEQAVMSTIAEVSKSQANVIIAEINGADWLQRNWRPIVACSFAFVLLFYVLLMPMLVAWVGVPPVRTGDLILEWTFQIIMISIGGYIGGRSLEKIADKIIKK